MKMRYQDLDTPALIIDYDTMLENIKIMQDYANTQSVALRPHTKTHKMPHLALIQQEYGCKGITVAKVGEAEIMAKNGLSDIFIANQIVGQKKLERIKELSVNNSISFGVDTPCQVIAANEMFDGSSKKAEVLIEIEVGEERSGIIEEDDYIELLKTIKECTNVHLKGIFSHEGHCYNSNSIEECREQFDISQRRTLHFAEIARQNGFDIEVVSIGSTPSLMQNFPIMDGITEIRPGTYILMDASMGATINSLERCAATVLTTIISKPTKERIITDVGAKGITAQKRTKGISATEGMGTIKEDTSVTVFDVYDEHAIIYNEQFSNRVSVGDKIEVIPVHICPVCNLHEKAYLVKNGEVISEVPVLCRGKLQ